MQTDVCTGGWELEFWGWELEAGGWERVTESWELGTGGRELVTELVTGNFCWSWELFSGVGNLELGARNLSQVLGCSIVHLLGYRIFKSDLFVRFGMRFVYSFC